MRNTVIKLKAEDFRVSPTPTLVRDEALSNLRHAIVSGFFKPGERLVERNLCEFLGVSRTLAREVLRHLESERLITVRPHKGNVVTSISLEEAEEIYEVRAILEEHAARAFTINATEKEVAKLRRISDKFAKAGGKSDLVQLVTLMSEFYDVLFQGGGNSVITEILTRLHARISMLRAMTMSQPDRVKFSVREMAAITDAIVRRDAEEAAQASKRHVHEAAIVALAGLKDRDNT